ncbi:MAG: ABC transporter ATP-binding protein/permease [Pirellulaceae bacterium]|nr:ABC transporter ATP-binding protein/permease [Pirellulaceae bacterium]
MSFSRRIWKLLRHDRRLMMWSVFFGLLFTGLGIIPPLLVGRMIRWIQSEAPVRDFFLLGGVLATIYLLRGVTRYFYGVTSHIAAFRTLHRLTNETYAHLQKMSPAFVNRQHTGNLVARSLGDVEAVEDFIAHGIPETMLAIVIPVTMSIVLFLIHWQLALISLLPLPFIATAVFVIASRTRNHWRGTRRRFAEVQARIQDHLSGLTVIQSFVQETEQARKVRIQSADYRDTMIYANKWSLVPAGIIEAASGAGLVLIVCAGSWIVRPATDATSLPVEVADLVVFLMYLGQIFLPFLRLANLTENLQKAAASAERVFELLDTKPTIVDHPQAAVPATSKFDLEFANVSFGYQSDQSVLREVSFRVEEGETVALVGMTGVGKTTACHLIVRFYDVDEGVIRLGGTDVRNLPLEYLRHQVAMVSQDVFLFHGTIGDNLRFGKPTATEEELAAAVQASQSQEFIDLLPQGLDTIVGERGVRLSGGQKQRVSIARALLKDAPVLLLDEATSAVDLETENCIKRALARVTAGRTVIVVAHRQSTIMAADRLVVLEQGRVVETGNYDDLMDAGGLFARLCQRNEDALI